MVYKHYYLEERPYAATSSVWKRCHIFLLVSASISSITSCVLFHILFATFDMNCVLNPKYIVFKIENLTDTTNPQLNTSAYKPTDLPVDYIKSQWANVNDCYGPLYNPLISVIFGIIWTTFFLMCSKGGKSVSGLEQSWRIVVPSAFFTFVYCIVCMVISSKLTDGLINFNTVFMNITDINSDKYHNSVKLIDTYVLVNIIISWLYTLCWILSFLLLVLRCACMPDFQLMQMRIHLIQNGANQNGIDKKIDYKSVTEATAISQTEKPSTSTGIFENPNTFLVQANIESNNNKKVCFEDFKIDQMYVNNPMYDLTYIDDFTAIASQK